MIALVLALVVTSTSVSSSNPCEDAAIFDPVALGFGDGPISSVRRACARDEIGLGATAVAIIEPKKFYGNLRAAGTLAASTAVLEDTELFAAIELVRYQTVIRSLSASSFSLGHLALGATQRIQTGDTWALAATAHTTLPTALGLYDRTYTLALDAGVAGTTRISADLELHAYAGGRASIGIGAGPTDPRAAVILDAGGAYRVTAWFAFAVDLEGASGERAPLDHAALGIGMRFPVSDVLRFDLAVKAPVAGDEQALASVYVGMAYWE